MNRSRDERKHADKNVTYEWEKNNWRMMPNGIKTGND
jgi:hypothetical protein